MKELVNRPLSFARLRGRAGAAAIAIFLAACCVLGPSDVQAKHAALGADQDDETPDASAPSGAGKSGQSTVITGEILEVHDRLTPDVFRGIKRVHSFRINLSGKNQIHEIWTVSKPDMGERLGRPGQSHGSANHRFGFKIKQTEDAATIGESGSRVVWHVLGEKKLQRIFAGQHFLMMIDIEIGADNSCHVNARYLQQTGFEFVVMRRSDTDELEHFTLPHVERASCEIQ